MKLPANLNEAKAMLVELGITAKVCTAGQAKKLILAKRAEMRRAKPEAHETTVTPTAATISKPAIAHVDPTVSKAKVVTPAKPAVLDVTNYLALRVKQISGVWMSKSELAILSVFNDATSAIESAIETLSKTSQYHEGILLSNAYLKLQKCEATKGLDPRNILQKIKTARVIKLKSERDKKNFVNWLTSSK